MPKRDKEMRTFIIPWDPDGSGFAAGQLRRVLPDPDYCSFDWPSDGLGQVRSGDNFYLVCMDGDPFVAMRGFFLTDPKPEGRIGMRPTFISWPDGDTPRLQMGTLGFDWSRYCNGTPLPETDGKAISALMDAFLEGQKETFFDGIHAERSRKPAANVDDAIGLAADTYCDEVDPVDGRPAIISILRVATQGKDDDEVICGALRDILGKAGWTPGRLREWGFQERIVDSLLVLQREKEETNGDFIRRVHESGDRLAILTMTRDLEDRISRGYDPKSQQY